EEELDEGALQPGTDSGEGDKSAGADAGGEFEIEETESRPDRDVVFRLESKGWFGSPFADDGIGRFVAADRTIGMRQVRYLQEQFDLPRFEGVGLFANGLDAIPDLAHPAFDFGRIFAVSTKDADLFGDAIAITLEMLFFRLAGAAFFVAGKNLIYQCPRLSPSRQEAGFCSFGCVAVLSDIMHDVSTVTQRPAPTARQAGFLAGTKKPPPLGEGGLRIVSVRSGTDSQGMDQKETVRETPPWRMSD